MLILLVFVAICCALICPEGEMEFNGECTPIYCSSPRACMQTEDCEPQVRNALPQFYCVPKCATIMTKVDCEQQQRRTQPCLWIGLGSLNCVEPTTSPHGTPTTSTTSQTAVTTTDKTPSQTSTIATTATSFTILKRTENNFSSTASTSMGNTLLVFLLLNIAMNSDQI